VTQIIHRTSFLSIIEDFKKLPEDTLIFIVDEKVWALYQPEMNFSQRIKDKKVIMWTAPEGEKSKTFSRYEACVESILQHDIHRGAHLIAIGGGAVSDMAGFVAATLLRGIKWSVVGTTLLSMVDASIGGKVAINSSFGKNLVGAFHKPTNIWLDYSFLKSLPESEYESGLGEVIKYAFLSHEVYNGVNNGESLEKIIIACCNFKKRITEDDLREESQRKILNLGHTLGHALEKMFSISHGRAVTWGMALMFSLYEREDLLDILRQVRKSLGLDKAQPPWFSKQFPLEKLKFYLYKDKKRAPSHKIDIILIDSIAEASIVRISFEDLLEKFEGAHDRIISLSI